MYRKKENEYIQAYFTASIINCQLKDPIQPKELLNPLWSDDKNKSNPMEDEEYLRKKFRIPKGGMKVVND